MDRQDLSDRAWAPLNDAAFDEFPLAGGVETDGRGLRHHRNVVVIGDEGAAGEVVISLARVCFRGQGSVYGERRYFRQPLRGGRAHSAASPTAARAARGCALALHRGRTQAVGGLQPDVRGGSAERPEHAPAAAGQREDRLADRGSGGRRRLGRLPTTRAQQWAYVPCAATATRNTCRDSFAPTACQSTRGVGATSNCLAGGCLRHGNRSPAAQAAVNPKEGSLIATPLEGDHRCQT